MSGGLAPSKSTVYVANLPFSLTNNDLHKIFEKYGKVVKVTIVKDKTSHQSKGIAFVLFLEKESAHKCVKALSNTQMFGRTLKCNIAKDNGRASEFIRRKIYKDKSRCYECGEEGHLSYMCPKNLLGEREPPPKKKKRKHDDDAETQEDSADESGNDEAEGEDPYKESLAAVIEDEALKCEEKEAAAASLNLRPQKKKLKKSSCSYFSDSEEEELDE